MYLTRQKASKKLPIQRKGTKYVARALSHVNDSVPVVIAIRDMLHLAQNAREVKHMIKAKNIKINGKSVKDYRESIRLFNILEADKKYRLTLSSTGKYLFVEIAEKENRIGKIINKRMVSGNKIQLNLHDGTNLLTDKKFAVGDSIYLDKDNKIVEHVPLDKGREAFIVKGAHTGEKIIIKNIEGNKAILNHKGGAITLDKKYLIAVK